MTTPILFIQGGGEGAYDEDALLADALGQALGRGYEVRFPKMPHEDEPDLAAWKKKIASELSRMPGHVILVGHSLGGSTLLRFLCDEKLETSIAAAYFLAAPAHDGKRWSFDDLALPDDVAEKLARIPRLVFFHCRDDDVVPFAHLTLHRARIPQAITHAFDTGRHQLDGHVTDIAAAVRGGAHAAP